VIIPGEPGLAAAYTDEQPVRDAYWHPAPGDTVIDIGAAVGSYTVPALLAGARVIAVDPDRGATAKLERVAAANGLTDFTVLNAAVFDSPGYPADMRAALEASEYPYLIPRPDVLWATLDEIAEGLDKVDLIKIDVEGAELGVLRSGPRVLNALRPRLLIEDHTEVYPYVAQIDSRRLCTELLVEAGYTVTEVPWGPPPRTYLVCRPN
jgi:FkbM family methyltransferase